MHARPWPPGSAAGRRVTSAPPSCAQASQAKLPAPVKDAYHHAVSNGTHVVFLWVAAIAVICFVAAWFVKEIPLRGGEPKTQGSGARRQELAVVEI